MPENFTTVYSKRTGRAHSVPNHYLDSPSLMTPFRRTPGEKGEELLEDAGPSSAWSLVKLREHAAANDIDITGAGRSKAAVLERIATASAAEVSSDTVSDDQSPAEGE